MKRLASFASWMMAKRPPMWAWGLAAFVGIVLANAIVPEAHGATFQALDAEPMPPLLAAIIGIVIGFILVGGLVARAACKGMRDPYEPDEATLWGETMGGSLKPYTPERRKQPGPQENTP